MNKYRDLNVSIGREGIFRAMYQSLLLLVVMVVTILSVPYLAADTYAMDEAEPDTEFAGGDGTKDDPYLVETAEQLDNIRNYLNDNFKQNAHIDLSDYNGGEWEPIGYGDPEEPAFVPFEGVYDGNDYEIANLTINETELEHVGLFGLISTAELKNINVINANVQGGKQTGLLIGTMVLGSVTNCHVEGDVTGYNTGGLAGLNGGGKINDSSADVEVEEEVLIGGLVGSNAHYDQESEDKLGPTVDEPVKGEIEDCYATGDVFGGTDSAQAGGLVGANGEGGVISSCHTNVNVKAPSSAAGAIAGSNGDTGYIIDSYAEEGSSVEAVFAGGVVGVNSGTVNEFSEDEMPIIENCYSFAEVTALAGGAGGGIVGLNDELGTVNESYSDNKVTGRHAGGVVGANVGIASNSYALGSVVATESDEDSIIGGVAAINGLKNYEGTDGEELGGEVNRSYSVATLNGGDVEGGDCRHPGSRR
ncbi:MAG: GLUG motif-containing protein [Chloroflexota bacterium]